jgi:hypothetical protein
VKGNSSGRESGIELLRIFLMVVIVLHHLIVHGCHLVNLGTLPRVALTYELLFADSFLVFPVCCFVFITGYFSTTLKARKIIGLWLQVFSYSVLFATVALFAHPSADNRHALLMSFFPVTSNQWWFMTCYLGLISLSPALNFLIEKLSAFALRYITVVGLVINSLICFVNASSPLGATGASLLSFIIIYVLAGYLRKTGFAEELKPTAWLSVGLGSCLVIAIAVLISYWLKCPAMVWRFYSINNPLVIAASMSAFFVFHKIRFRSNAINYVGSLVLGVYLIHDNVVVRYFIVNRLGQFNARFAAMPIGLNLFLFALVIYAACLLIEAIRKLIADFVLDRLFQTTGLNKLENSLLRLR